MDRTGVTAAAPIAVPLHTTTLPFGAYGRAIYIAMTGVFHVLFTVMQHSVPAFGRRTSSSRGHDARRR